ncbi:hypothetical protein [Streptomyces sp. NPDC004376]
MSTVIYLDLGRSVLGYPTQIAGEQVCVLSSHTATDRDAHERVRQFMTAQGRDCEICRACPAGQAK